MIMKLSIITINLNNSNGLLRTIESIKAQTDKLFEYIIIDGGSTDGSIDVIKNNVDHISFWISEKDRGIYHAMNKGVQYSTGDFCLFLNSGDWLYSNIVVELAKKWMTNDIDILNGYQWNISNTGHCTRNIIGSPKKIYIYSLLNKWLSHGSTFIRRSLLINRPYDENLKIVSDWKFFVESIAYDNIRYRHIDLDVSYFDMTGISSSSPKLLQQEGEETRNKIVAPILLNEIRNIPPEIADVFNSVLNIRVRNLMISIIQIIAYIYYLLCPRAIQPKRDRIQLSKCQKSVYKSLRNVSNKI